MKNLIFLVIMTSFGLIASCNEYGEEQTVFSGRMDADVILVSAKGSGEIDSLVLDEGMTLSKGQVVGKIDTRRLLIQQRQQRAQVTEIDANTEVVKSQIKQVNEQYLFTSNTLKKTDIMFQEGAATQQTYDELSTNVAVLEAKLAALHNQLKVLQSKKEQVVAAMSITTLGLEDAVIKSPITGTVLNKFKNLSELAGQGTPLFEIADLSRMEAVFYVPLTAIDRYKIGMDVTITIDANEDEYPAKIKWISSKSEFTPKTILTRDTRETLVYAVKLSVPNPDGIFKIGMPAEVEL